MLKVKESERDNAQYAKPRPRYLLASPQEERITSPYDHPRSSGKATPTSPNKPVPLSNVVTSIEGLLGTESEVGGDTVGPLESHSDPQSGRQMVPQQSNTSLGFTPQYTATPLLEERESHLKPHPPPVSMASPAHQPLTSTPVSLQVPPSLNIQMANDSNLDSAHSPHSSPLMSRTHPPSPLVFNSTSMCEDSP